MDATPHGQGPTQAPPPPPPPPPTSGPLPTNGMQQVPPVSSTPPYVVVQTGVAQTQGNQNGSHPENSAENEKNAPPGPGNLVVPLVGTTGEAPSENVIMLFGFLTGFLLGLWGLLFLCVACNIGWVSNIQESEEMRKKWIIGWGIGFGLNFVLIAGVIILSRVVWLF